MPCAAPATSLAISISARTIAGRSGSGSIDFASAFSALRDIDYAGWITFESFSSEVLDEGLSNDIAIWRNMWSDNVALSDHAYRYMVVQIEASMVRSGKR
jgi:D-psicose/D-tagatose/L-ribulose 3-epimerase